MEIKLFRFNMFTPITVQPEYQNRGIELILIFFETFQIQPLDSRNSIASTVPSPNEASVT